MRVFIASLRTETNSFVRRRTTLDDFRAGDLTAAGDDVDATAHPGYAAFVDAAERAGCDVARGPAAYAVPGGPVAAETYAALKADLLAALDGAGPVDLVLLDLHGAMIAEGTDDCEGDVLTAARVAAPGAVVAALLDLHTALSPTMVRAADLLHAYKEYPHIDVAERAQDLFRLAEATRRGDVRPVAAVVPCRALGGFPTQHGPMRDLVAWMTAQEGRGGVLATSLLHGFPWSDSADNGAKALVYADGDRAAAQSVADGLAARFRAILPDAAPPTLTVEEGVARARAAGGRRLILADASDNPGGGGDGDATHLLRALRDAGATRVGAALIFDAEALAACRAAGVGAELTLSVGGKMSGFSGAPLQLSGRVAALADRVEAAAGASAKGPPVGPLARFATDFGDLILSAQRREALWPELFTALGADLSDYGLLVLKSSNHFRAAFAPLVDEVVSVGSPTAMNPDLAALPYARLPRPMWPLDDLAAC